MATDEGRLPSTLELELFSHRFEAVAREMGALLRRTALSTNIKERLDFSCALLDGRGRLVVNAPHIPVHLGALGMCVRRLAAEVEMEPGDVVVTNHPGYGGSHLPDVTVVTPVFAGGRDRPEAYVASRAHHAEIGGTHPGSVPPAASSLAEEGVVIPPVHLVRRGRPRFAAVERLLEEAPWPSRAVEENLADLAAEAAANRLGAEALRGLMTEHGTDVVRAAMAGLERRAARLARSALERVPDGVHRAREHLDDGTPLEVRLEVRGGEAEIDFAGTGGVHSGNLNATPAIVTSVVLYVLRLLVDEPLPLNEGLLEPVRLIVPQGLLDPPFPADPARAPAVVGGNVETSQRLVDTLLRALGLVACSQGTMNNVIFGDAGFGYYETVAGGAGAGPGFNGASAVHTHMTNTRITDPEVLEHRFPVRLERFGLRRGSGGGGRWRGGDGVLRELVFLRPLTLAVLGQHRCEGPYGMAGGAAGAPARQRLVRADGEVEELGGIDARQVAAGDRFVLETPGGGGWGEPDAGEPEEEPCAG